MNSTKDNLIGYYMKDNYITIKTNKRINYAVAYVDPFICFYLNHNFYT
ncbi:hypothetical protein CMALT430_210034 [Carnobacterium maltaromaticum]|nr:hypothetical protein CMALT430_210034 [Carnobacterium maltaromaticum]